MMGLRHRPGRARELLRLVGSVVDKRKFGQVFKARCTTRRLGGEVVPPRRGRRRETATFSTSSVRFVVTATATLCVGGGRPAAVA